MFSSTHQFRAHLLLWSTCCLLCLSFIHHHVYWCYLSSSMIFLDNINTIDIFNFLQVITLYNQLLISAMNVILDHDIDFKYVVLTTPSLMPYLISRMTLQLVSAWNWSSGHGFLNPHQMCWGQQGNNGNVLFILMTYKACLDTRVAHSWMLDSFRDDHWHLHPFFFVHLCSSLLVPIRKSVWPWHDQIDLITPNLADAT